MTTKRDPSVDDLDGNGVADIREPWFIRGIFGVALFIVRIFAPPHTIARRGMEGVNQAIKVNLVETKK